MTPNRLFWTKASIGISSIVIFIAGIAVKALWPKEIAPVVSDINALMILSSGIFGGLIRDVLGFKRAPSDDDGLLPVSEGGPSGSTASASVGTHPQA